MEELPVEIGRDCVAELLQRCNAPEGVIDEKFVGEMQNLACAIQIERQAQGIKLYGIDDMRLVCHAATMAAKCHKGQTRHSGEGVFEGHLYPTVFDGLVKTLGRTRVAVLAAGFLHDTKEEDVDTGVGDQEHFVAAWESTFKSGDSLLFRSGEVRARIWKLVGGASKIRKDTRANTSAATFRKLLAAFGTLGPDSPHVKMADRKSNMRTIAGHHNPDKEKEIARETYEAFCPLGQIIGIQDMVRELVDLCSGVLNPQLKAVFYALADERRNAQLARETSLEDGAGKVIIMNYINDTLKRDGMTVDFVQDGLARYALSRDASLESLDLEDLGVNRLNPLFEVRVLVKPGVKIEEIVSLIVQKFAEPVERRDVDANQPNEVQYLGTRIAIYSKHFGLLRFRVNDTVSEARLKRGISKIETKGPVSNRDLDPELRATVQGILRDTASGTDFIKTLSLARDRLFCEQITLYTPTFEPKRLIKGATGLDFMASVHSEFLRNRMCVVCSKSGVGKEFRVNPLDSLEDGVTIQLMPDSSDEPSLPENMKIDPGWMLFCKTGKAKRALSDKVLSADGPDAILQRGREYILKIQKMFGIPESEILRAAYDEWKSYTPGAIKANVSEERLCKEIGKGKMEILGLLARACFEDRVEWPISVEMPHTPGTLSEFIREFKDNGINIRQVSHFPPIPPEPARVFMTLNDSTDKGTPFDMMVAILKLSYSYNIAIVSDKAAIIGWQPVRRLLEEE
ncbi:HD domain-containing protein [Candidatus Peregrinibacteria bacterium]|nr:HD domain-containing protein [Candidatus Peregrinibacteria bacterium]